ncbi:MAG: hypothetical protein ACLU6Y_00560 [Ruminococcus sp.]
MPDGNVDVCVGGRIGKSTGRMARTKIDAPILGNGDLLAAVAGMGSIHSFLVYDQ